MSEIADLIKRIVEDNEEMYSLVGKVIDIDFDKRTCTIEPVDGSAIIYEVRLQSKVSQQIGLVLIPDIQSDVIVTFLSKELAFISKTNKITALKLDINDTSLIINEETIRSEVKNKINLAEEYLLQSKNAKFEIESSFEVVSEAVIKMVAQTMSIELQTLSIQAQTSINGNTSVTGTFSVIGSASVSGALTAASATIAGSMSVGGGNNGGVIKGGGVKDEIDKIVNDLNDLKNRLSSWTPVNNDGGAALKSILNSYANDSLDLVDLNGISNNNFTH